MPREQSARLSNVDNFDLTQGKDQQENKNEGWKDKGQDKDKAIIRQEEIRDRMRLVMKTNQIFD
jgi:hypothetical protein